MVTMRDSTMVLTVPKVQISLPPDGSNTAREHRIAIAGSYDLRARGWVNAEKVNEYNAATFQR